MQWLSIMTMHGRRSIGKGQRLASADTLPACQHARLGKGEEQGHVGVDALLLQLLTGADSLPGRGDLRAGVQLSLDNRYQSLAALRQAP